MADTIKRLERWLDALSDRIALLSVFSLVLLTLLITFSVLMRYLFNNALTWSDEIASYCLVAIVFLGLSHTLIKGGHIRIDVLTNLLSEPLRNRIQLACYAVGLCFSLFLVLATYHRIENFWVRNTVSFTELRTPLYIPALPLLIGAVMMLLTMMLKLASLWLTMLGMERSRPLRQKRRP